MLVLVSSDSVGHRHYEIESESDENRNENDECRRNQINNTESASDEGQGLVEQVRFLQAESNHAAPASALPGCSNKFVKNRH